MLAQESKNGAMVIHLALALPPGSCGLPSRLPLWGFGGSPYPLRVSGRLALLHVEIAAFHPFDSSCLTAGLAQDSGLSTFALILVERLVSVALIRPARSMNDLTSALRLSGYAALWSSDFPPPFLTSPHSRGRKARGRPSGYVLADVSLIKEAFRSNPCALCCTA